MQGGCGSPLSTRILGWTKKIKKKEKGRGRQSSIFKTTEIEVCGEEDEKEKAGDMVSEIGSEKAMVKRSQKEW